LPFVKYLRSASIQNTTLLEIMNLKYKTQLCSLFYFFLLIESTHAQNTLFLDRQEYSCATSFSLSLRTKNISNVVALQGTIFWDTAVVNYNSISFGSSSILLNSSNLNMLSTGQGTLGFLWYDNNLSGQSAADSSILFTLSFTLNGTGKGKTEIMLANSPTSLEIDTLAAGGVPVMDQSAVFINGYIITPTTYNFIGSGNWNIAANWKDNLVPPPVLPACSEININPAGIAECVLNVPQMIAPGARLIVGNNKKLTVSGKLTIQ
jgi:hypothetical protein